MANVGYATLDVIPSLRGFRSKLEQGSSADFTAAGRTGGRKFGDAAGKEAGASFRSKFSDGLKGVAAPLAGIFAGAAIVSTFKDAIAGASDLAESGNKIQAIFGDASTQVQQFARSAATSLGQTQVQALDAASTFGTFGKAAGLTGRDLAGFSEKLVGLSADMASFFNTSPDQAIEAIGAALRGEAEPIRAYGVLLDDATLRQEALRQGLVKTTKQALTPQQKVLAACQVILKQTAAAQGDFERTSGGLANQQRILSAQVTELKTKLGAELLPAAVNVTRAFNDGVVPAIETAGGAVGDAASSFNSLPGPVKAATGALIAFKVASALGFDPSAVVARTAGSFDSLRLRAMLAADAFREARGGVLELTGNTGKFVAPATRMSASLTAVRTAASGAGRALKSGLGGAVSLLGGPWGLAFAGAAAAVTLFYQKHQQAKQFVDDLTESLDKQTGAVTDNTKELAFNALEKSGAIDAARRLGINLEDVRLAALSNADALTSVNNRLEQYQANVTSFGGRGGGGSRNGMDQDAVDARTLATALGDTSGALGDARDKARDFAEFMGKGNVATGQAATQNGAAASSFKSMADRINEARNNIKRLMDAEEQRRLSNVQARRDKIALIETEKAANKEAAEGKKTLDINTKAGRENMTALLDLADQWNNSANSVRNAKGAYSDIRETFIKLAEKMGASKEEAKKLANNLINLPPRKKVDISTPGMKDALADLKLLKQRITDAQNLAIRVNTKQANDPRLRGFAGGGKVGGTGYGDKQMILADSREWVMNPRSVSYYGDSFMDAINRRLLPRFANGGPVAPRAATSTRPGISIQNLTVVSDDPLRWKRDLEHDARAAAIGAESFT